jgi:hypothetical protein
MKYANVERKSGNVLRSQMVDGYLGYGMESESFNSNAEESD